MLGIQDSPSWIVLTKPNLSWMLGMQDSPSWIVLTKPNLSSILDKQDSPSRIVLTKPNLSSILDMQDSPSWIVLTKPNLSRILGMIPHLDFFCPNQIYYIKIRTFLELFQKSSEIGYAKCVCTCCTSLKSPHAVLFS
jgi:hypothetical protein